MSKKLKHGTIWEIIKEKYPDDLLKQLKDIEEYAVFFQTEIKRNNNNGPDYIIEKMDRIIDQAQNIRNLVEKETSKYKCSNNGFICADCVSQWAKKREPHTWINWESPSQMICMDCGFNVSKEKDFKCPNRKV